MSGKESQLGLLISFHNIFVPHYARNGGPLTRNSRAMVRILYSRGVHKTKIARMIGCHPLTVTNIITGTTLIAARDDPTQDYSFVDTTFKAKYPPTSDMKSVSLLLIPLTN